MERSIWRERAYDATDATALVACGLSPIVVRLLAARGIGADGLEAFFDPSLKRLAAPDALPGVDRAVAVIGPFVREGKKIIVFGDYDVDGVCACAILVKTLKKLGATAEAFIPHRFDEGYGITPTSVERLFREHPDVALVVTVDNGITAAEEIARLRARGVAVVVTDHHLPPPAEDAAETSPIPEAEALVDPRVAGAPGCEDLCGAGVAFFLSCALVTQLREFAEEKGHLRPNEKIAAPLIVLAGLATVADLMPLRGQNRVLVAAAVANCRACAPLGVRELLDHSTRRAEALVARDFAFLLAPRLNAAGRMADALTAYRLLMEDDRETARKLAIEVDNLNVLRKTEEMRMDAEARAQLAPDAADAGAVVVAEADRPADSPPWNSGVAGIVASRILESMHVPVAVVVSDHGSCRAPAGYNVHDALAASAEALTRFGGHAAAGGFSVKEGRLADFRRLFAAACAAQKAAVPDAAATPFDGWIAAGDLSMDLYHAVKRLEPFGEGNPEPVFGMKGVFFSEAQPMGMDGRHATFRFTGRNMPRAVWWGHGADADYIRAHAAARYDVLFTLIASDYGSDVPHLELRIVDMRPTV